VIRVLSLAQKTYNLTEAAGLIGISPITLKRWLLNKKVDEVARDRNNWRCFSEKDITRIKKYADRVIIPGETNG
jgi:predicted site-specific integrase-resolvase